MKIKYEVYFKDYWTKRSDNIGFFVDFWSCVDYERGRKLAKKYYGAMVKDPDALFVLKGRE